MNAGKAIGVVAGVVLLLLVCTDLGLRVFFPHFARLSDNFSSSYLRREIASVAADRSAIVFLGDSALWGYHLPAAAAAVSRLRSEGCDCRNLSFEGGSPANTYAMLRLLLRSGTGFRTIVFNVNQKELNPADSAYRTLHPSVETLAWPLLSQRDKGALISHAARDANGAIDDVIARGWALYGFRADLREALFGDVDAVHAVQTFIQDRTGAGARLVSGHDVTPDRFEGMYDLTPLANESDNVSVSFLRRIGDLTRSRKVRVLALLTPTNHRLLHDYIDTRAYTENVFYTKRLLEGYGVAVVDLDRFIPAGEFLDNDHLNDAGNRRLADFLRSMLGIR